MTAGTQDDAKGIEEALSNGLRANHCYTVVQIHVIKQTKVMKGGPLRLLLLRNPWGKNDGTWNGKWSDMDEISWKHDVGVKPTMEDDGFAWIELHDYMKNFSFTNICQYNEDDISSYTYMSPENHDKISYFHVVVDKS